LSERSPPNSRSNRADVALCVALFVLVGVVFWISASFPTTDNLAKGFGVDFLPRFYAGAILLLAFAILWQGRRDDEDAAEGITFRVLARPAGFLGTMFAYVLALPHLGFLLATPALLFVLMLILRVPPLRAITAALGLTAGIYGIFDLGLNVPLPVIPDIL